MKMLMAMAALGLVAAGCSHRAPQALAPRAPRALPAPALAGLVVQLVWEAPVDLDLYVTDPTWESLYFANNPSRSGARLVRDVRCADVRDTTGVFVEVAHLETPAAGPYRVGVDFIDGCGAAGEDLERVSFRVAAVAGPAQLTAVGVLRVQEFQPMVLEFELDQSDGAQPPRLLRLRPEDGAGPARAPGDTTGKAP